MKLWVDDLRLPPEGYAWVKSVYEAKDIIDFLHKTCQLSELEEISLDHDSGVYNTYGGDYIKILNYMEYLENIPGNSGIFSHLTIEIHTMNSVGFVNMKAICQKNNWKVVY